MKAEIVNVTPQMASDWLKLNTDNRPLRRSVVDGFKYALMRGEYITTHQGIAFSDKGVLLDGQHRLTAISELRDGAYQMLVVRGVSVDAFKVMDIGVKRTNADALKENPRLVEVARLAATYADATNRRPTPTSLIPYIEKIEPHYRDLMEFCPTYSKVWTSAPVRLAAIVAMLRGGDADYIKAIYRAMVKADFKAMPSIAQALYRAQVNGTLISSDRIDMMARFFYAFDKKRAHNTTVRIADKYFATALVRETFAEIVAAQTPPPEKKTAAPKGTAKSISRDHYRTAAH